MHKPWRRRLGGAGDEAIGFVYYSGHGLAHGGENYLVPTDGTIEDPSDVRPQSVALSETVGAFEDAHAKALFVVFDACRTSYLSGATRGLALVPVPARRETVVAFSTKSEDVAKDDGLYAIHLARELSRPGADLRFVFAEVTTSVAIATNRGQSRVMTAA
jgi:uncharacterized caspase-like protein